jgi:hypothetical protein
MEARHDPGEVRLRPAILAGRGRQRARRRRGRQGHRGGQSPAAARGSGSLPGPAGGRRRPRRVARVSDQGDTLRIGARTTHYDRVGNPLVAAHCGLLAEAAGTVADPAVRHRGTLGGSLAHGDPAGDLPAVVLALDATLTARGPGGEREISAADFFVDYLTTALQPGEILTAVTVPKLGDGWVSARSSTGRRKPGPSSAWPR